jgi:hypothetical protein
MLLLSVGSAEIEIAAFASLSDSRLLSLAAA